MKFGNKSRMKWRDLHKPTPAPFSPSSLPSLSSWSSLLCLSSLHFTWISTNEPADIIPASFAARGTSWHRRLQHFKLNCSCIVANEEIFLQWGRELIEERANTRKYSTFAFNIHNHLTQWLAGCVEMRIQAEFEILFLVLFYLRQRRKLFTPVSLIVSRIADRITTGGTATSLCASWYKIWHIYRMDFYQLRQFGAVWMNLRRLLGLEFSFFTQLLITSATMSSRRECLEISTLVHISISTISYLLPFNNLDFKLVMHWHHFNIYPIRKYRNNRANLWAQST